MNQTHSHYENPFYCREQANLEIAYDMITSRARQLQRLLILAYCKAQNQQPLNGGTISIKSLGDCEYRLHKKNTVYNYHQHLIINFSHP